MVCLLPGKCSTIVEFIIFEGVFNQKMVIQGESKSLKGMRKNRKVLKLINFRSVLIESKTIGVDKLERKREWKDESISESEMIRINILDKI